MQSLRRIGEPSLSISKSLQCWQCVNILVFAMTVVSFPLMLDRHVDMATAVKTSIAAVEANPGVMLVWGLTITALLVLGSLPVAACRTA